MSRFWSAMAFLFLVVVANWLTATYGLIPVGFGLVVTAGTWAAGLVLVARDLVQDAAGRLAVLALIVVGAVLSALLTNPALGIASGVAFTVSELADFAVYTPLRRRGWARAVVWSSVAGSIVDSAIFLTLAGFPISALPGQVIVKMAAMVAVVVPVVVIRAVLRNRVRAEGA